MISFDTETTGLDLHHGAKPYFVTITKEDGEQLWWEWDVDPLTRQPIIPEGDWDEIEDTIDGEEIVLQNPKFDVSAMRAVKPFKWNWSKTHDTLIAGHLLASNQPHDLTTMALVYLNVNIERFENKLKVAVDEARRIARSKFPTWRIASKDLPEMPSAKDSVWRFDMWLPRAIAKACKYPKNHLWWTVLADYGNGDSAVTLPLFIRQTALLKERGLWKIYLFRRKLLRIVYEMEARGVTVSKARLEQAQTQFLDESIKAGRLCKNIAKEYNYDLTLPKSGNSKSLNAFVFGEDGLALEPVKKSKRTGTPSLDKATLEHYEATLPYRSAARLFVTNLRGKRKRDTALSYMESYKRFWKPLEMEGWYRLHSSLNPTGTDTLRFASNNPNQQNISKQEGFNLRSAFGPAPGREWWSLDAKNIELRLPAYEAGETEMISLFERPNDPPYYGSYHMLIFATLHPEKFAQHGMACKEVFESTWYQWTKNGNFAVQYGAVEASGTADRAYHIPGAQKLIQSRFGKIAGLNQHWIEFAEENGYVETMPDKTIDPLHGYPLLCTRSRWGGILPTVPLNYHVQGTAMWWMTKAMWRCQDYLDGLNKGVKNLQRNGFFMVMQVHDELVFDFPVGKGDTPHKTNLHHIHHIQDLMQEGGNDIGVPTPVSCKYHPQTWSVGLAA